MNYLKSHSRSSGVWVQARTWGDKIALWVGTSEYLSLVSLFILDHKLLLIFPEKYVSI